MYLTRRTLDYRGLGLASAYSDKDGSDPFTDGNGGVDTHIGFELSLRHTTSREQR